MFRIEMEKLVDEKVSSSTKGKSWTLFSNDFQAQNFKVVADTVFKWTAIIGGSLYLIYSIVSLLEKG